MRLGGRAAENVVFGRVSSGAEDDLKTVTRLAYDQVKLYGMSAAIGPLSFPVGDDRSDEFLPKPYSRRLQYLIDQVSQLTRRPQRRPFFASLRFCSVLGSISVDRQSLPQSGADASREPQ